MPVEVVRSMMLLKAKLRARSFSSSEGYIRIMDMLSGTLFLLYLGMDL